MSAFHMLGSTGLKCHPFGFGCYRIADGNPDHEAALRQYLGRGGNLIDTSSNYGDGASEELVGKVTQGLPRERAIIVTKGGYIQGQNMALAQQRTFPEVVEYGPGIWHCIHPEFLQTQIELSCSRLQRDSIDVYLLHNPEYFLEAAAHQRALTLEDHEEFYRRIRQAFAYLEEQAANGVIGWYGVSSNNFVMPDFEGKTPTAMTSVRRCLAEAQSVSKDHHFRVAQFPLNLYEPGAAVEPNQGGRTVLEFCREEGIGALANRPLNAFFNNQLVRLADWSRPGEPPPGEQELERLLTPLQEQEQRYAQLTGEPLQLAGGEGVSQLLQRVVPQLPTVSHWRQMAPSHVVEPINGWLASVRERLGQSAEGKEWLRGLIGVINPLLHEVEGHIGARQQPVSDQARQRLLDAGYPSGQQPLSQMALHVLTNLEGLSSVLVGMRRTSYVEEAMSVPELEPIDGLSILKRFN